MSGWLFWSVLNCNADSYLLPIDFKSGTDEFTSSGSTAEDDHRATSNISLPYPQPETAPEDTSKLDTAGDVSNPRQIQQEQQQQKESAPPLDVPKANHDRRQLIEFKGMIKIH